MNTKPTDKTVCPHCEANWQTCPDHVVDVATGLTMREWVKRNDLVTESERLRGLVT